jgi:hypothetical protein
VILYGGKVRLYGVRLILYETPMMGRLIPCGGVLKSAFC